MLPPPAIRGVFRTDDARAGPPMRRGPASTGSSRSPSVVPSDRDDLHRAGALGGRAPDPARPARRRQCAWAAATSARGSSWTSPVSRRRLDIRAARAARHHQRQRHAAPSSTARPIRHGLRLPPDPSSGRWATLGGMVSTNAAGARSVRYGSVRRWVVGLELVTAEAKCCELTPRRGGVARTATATRSSLRGRGGPGHRRGAGAHRRSLPSDPEELLRLRASTPGSASDDLLDLSSGPRGRSGSSPRRLATRSPARPTAPVLRVRAPIAGRPGEGRRRAARLRALRGRAARSDLPRPDPPHRDGRSVSPAAEAILLVEIERDDPRALREAVAKASEGVRPWAAAVDTALTAASSAATLGASPRREPDPRAACRRTAARCR